MAMKFFVSAVTAIVVTGWSALALAQCGGGSAEMKKIMGYMKDFTVKLVEADQKLGEKNPDAKEAKVYQTNAQNMAKCFTQLAPMLTDAKCKMAGKKMRDGISSLMKACKAKDKKSTDIHEGISQIRATCSDCHDMGCPGL